MKRRSLFGAMIAAACAPALAQAVKAAPPAIPAFKLPELRGQYLYPDPGHSHSFAVSDPGHSHTLYAPVVWAQAPTGELHAFLGMAGIPATYRVCNGCAGTPDLRGHSAPYMFGGFQR